jgi:hypothetical protein
MGRISSCGVCSLWVMKGNIVGLSIGQDSKEAMIFSLKMNIFRIANSAFILKYEIFKTLFFQT